MTGNITAGTSGSIIAGTSGTGTVKAEYGGFSDGGSITVEPSSSVFVSATTGDDTAGTGSSNSPYKTLGYAYSVATGNIFMAGGEYNLTSQLVITNSNKIYGGYSPSDWSRDIQKNATRITETSSYVGTSAIPTSPIAISSSGDPELNGQYITGKQTGDCTAAVHVQGGSPSIIACSLDGGAGTDATYGLKIDNASAYVNFSQIKGATAGSHDTVFGVNYSNSSSGSLLLFNSLVTSGLAASNTTAVKIASGASTDLLIYNCAIIAGSYSSFVAGIVLNNQISGNVCNNTIVAYNGLPGFSYGVSTALSSTTGFIFDNNIVQTYGLSGVFCITNSTSVSMTDCSSNLFYISGSTPNYFWKTGTAYNWAASGTFFAFSSTATGNICGNPEFVSSDDLRLGATSPAKGSGLNGKIKGWVYFPESSSIPIDLGSKGRSSTDAWSIGAYE